MNYSEMLHEAASKKEWEKVRKLLIVLAIENVSNFQMHNEPRLFQRIF